jgi:hypothetical protein
MSPAVGHNDQATRGFAARRTARSRRADAATVAEMARSLLHDAREADSAAAYQRHDGAGRAERAARRELASANGRLTARPFAARRA